MSKVQAQYEAFPYPERNPKDEAKRLITGSPSIPQEMDHHLWGGQRDWSQPLRALFAGGGTGDGLIQLAQRLTDAGKPYEITYIDLSTASRQIAEARAKVRGLDGISFVTGSLLDAPDYGPFDYIDCCGVLHHLPDPLAGLSALKAAIAPNGGLGFMVYAPYGRSGVYPLQKAFNTLYGHLPPKSQIKHAKKIFAAIPDGHPFKRNPHVADHKQSDAGFYDLLLHSQDRAYRVGEWIDSLEETGWSLAQFSQPGLYDIETLTDAPPGLSTVEAMSVAEALRGTIKNQVGYARRAEDKAPEFSPLPDRIPHLNNMDPKPLASAVAAKQLPNLRVGSERVQISLKPDIAPLIEAVDGRRCVKEIFEVSGLSGDKALRLWTSLERAFEPWGLLHYSTVLAH